MDLTTQLLQQHISKHGVNLQDHLQDIFAKYIKKEGITNDCKSFEVISNFIKRNQFVYKNPKSDNEVNNIAITHDEIYEWVQQNLKLFKEYQTLKKQKELNILFPNFINDSAMFEWAGVNFGEEESLRINMSLRKLQNETKATQLRLWGKILARENDYFIAEGITSNLYADEVPQGVEGKGEGANTYTYWATHNVLGEWFELPYITPEQIQAAREIKYILTGSLNANVNVYPPFPGKEKHLLRAQIARISAATVLCPKDLYTFNEETKVLEFGEEPFKLQEYSEIKTLDNWVHLQAGLLNLGRCSYWVDPSMPEEKREERLAELAEKDPEIERLKPISEEKSPYWKEGDEEEQPNWLIKEYGDTQQYNLIGKDEGNVGCYGTIALKNLTWPGAYLVSNSKTWANIYIGYGLKVNQNPFNPVQPPNIQDEGDDIEEFPEPNPDKPENIIEPDSDKEGKEGEEGEDEEA